MSLYTVQLVFIAVWLAVTGSLTLANIVFALIVSTLALGLIRHQLPGGRSHWLRLFRVLSLVLLFVK